MQKIFIEKNPLLYQKLKAAQAQKQDAYDKDSFQADADLRQPVVSGVIRRQSKLDFQSANEAGLERIYERLLAAGERGLYLGRSKSFRCDRPLQGVSLRCDHKLGKAIMKQKRRSGCMVALI